MADTNADDLDQILDSALEDFSSLGLSSGGPCSSPSAAAPKGLGLGLGLPELGKGKKKGKKIEQNASAAAALEELRRQTREAVKGLESATAVPTKGGLDFDNDAMEDFIKQFEELGASQGMEDIVESMMQQLLSKDILLEPMKEIGEKYPKWLEEHKAELKQEEYDRYSHQYNLILQLNDVYEHDPDNFQKIVDLMQKMQECGQPPNDIMKELTPDLDIANFGQLFPEMQGSSSNCSIM